MRFSALIMLRVLFPGLRGGLLAGLLLLALPGGAAAQEQRVLVLGDSISAAYGMSLEQGWVALMTRQFAADGLQAQVVNASISGETSAGGLRRLPQLLAQHRPTLVIIQLGANDGLRGYPLDALQRNLQQMVGLVTATGARAILLPMEIPPNYGARYTSGFRATFAAVADATGAVLGPFPLQGVATDPALMQADGLHPTVEAQPLLLANVLPVVVAALEAG